MCELPLRWPFLPLTVTLMVLPIVGTLTCLKTRASQKAGPVNHPWQVTELHHGLSGETAFHKRIKECGAAMSAAYEPPVKLSHA